MSDLLIKDLIDQARGRKRDILLELLELSWHAYNYITRGGAYMDNYHALQRTKIWAEAKALLLEYHTEDGVLLCEICGEPVKSPLIHHLSYPFHSLFCPSYIKIICKSHHRRGTKWSRQ